MKKQFLTLLIVLAGFLLGGCYPEGAEYTDDLDVVITNYKEAYDFTAKSTYAMPDFIVKITGDLDGSDLPTYIKDIYAIPILARIEQNMESLGYTRVDVGADPELLLFPASWETTTIYYYYDYWYGWYGGWYGWYYPPVYGGSYTTGTMVMTLVDPGVEETTGNPVIQWTGAINGLMTGTYNATRINKAIDQAFTQSPYLRTN
jgi:hypothetical protein